MFIYKNIKTILNDVDIPFGRVRAIDIKKRLSKLFKNVKITIEKSNTLLNDDYAISGFYLEELGKIQILLIVSNGSKGYLKIENPDTFKFHIAQTIQHEYIHHCQFMKRDELSIDSFSLCSNGTIEQKYLGERDEIDAYSYDIALEVNMYGWNNSQTLNIYRKQFASNHPIIKRLLKKTYKNLGILNGTEYRRINERHYDYSSESSFIV